MLTHEFIFSPATHQSPRAGSSWRTLVSISTTRGTSFTVSCYPFFTMLTSLFIIPVAAQSHLQTGKCPTNFPQMENTVHRINVTASSSIEFPRFHRSVLYFPQTLSPSTMAPSLNRVGSLLAKPKDSNLLLTSSAESTSLFTYMSSTYADVAFSSAHPVLRLS